MISTTRRGLMAMMVGGGWMAAAQQAASAKRVKSLKITLLTTMLAERGIGEWGFAALVEVDGRRILFDTGARPDTLLINTKELGISLDGIRQVVLSHNHGDHTVGLASVRAQLAGAQVHVGKGIFYSRPGRDGTEGNFLLKNQAQLRQSLKFVEHDKPAELAPGVWLTGPVPRKYPERNFPGTGRMVTPEGIQDDNVPEDSSLVFDTDQGLVVLSGCGHAGIANTLEYSRTIVRPDAPVHAAIGGWHLFQLDQEKLAWTAGKMRECGVKNFLGAHCTGLEAVYKIRELNRMARENCVVGAVGASFDLAKGIAPGMIAR